jgi:tRNA-uridine 2-sulfurtransferase
MKTKTVLIAMSGGVDSSVAALLLKKKGYNLIGIFIKNFSETKNKLTNQCNWREERKAAKKIAAILKIPLITLDFEKQYKKLVLEPMFKSYKKGLTPNPDIACNTIIKFPLLWKTAKKYNAEHIATGHYAKIRKYKKEYQLLMGKDKTKDQSYFLSELSQKDLSHTIFPVGNLTKSKVRNIAKKKKFPNYDKKGTAGICFVGKVNMKSFLERKIKNKKGKILDPNNNIIGTHPGNFYFTIGQRIGPRLGFKVEKELNGKWYVAEKKNNTITIAPQYSPLLKKKIIIIKKLHLINPKKSMPKGIKARLRHLGPLHKGKLTKHNNTYKFTLNNPTEQIAEGQFIVFYKNSRLIASGEIRYH